MIMESKDFEIELKHYRKKLENILLDDELFLIKEKNWNLLSKLAEKYTNMVKLQEGKESDDSILIRDYIVLSVQRYIYSISDELLDESKLSVIKVADVTRRISLAGAKYGTSIEDLLMESNVILLKELKNYNSEYSLTTFIYNKLIGELPIRINNERGLIRIPRDVFEKFNKEYYSMNKKEFISHVSKNLEQTRQYLENKSPIEIASAIYFSLSGNYKQLDEDIDFKRDTEKLGVWSGFNFYETLSELGFEENYDDMNLKADINDVLNSLSPLEKDIILKRYGIEDDNEMQFREIARDMSVPKSRIEKIYNTGIRKLRHPSKSDVLLDYYNN